MPTVFQGDPKTAGGRFAVVVSRYNDSVTSRLLAGALTTLAAHGVGEERVDVAWMPGAFEIPMAADRLAHCGRYAAVLCLGAVIRGETSHDQHINRAVSLALSQSALHAGVPVLFGVLTCDTLEQAMSRAGGSAGNKGQECAQAALEMVSLLAQLPS